MKLYFAPLSCSFAMRVVAEEATVPLDYEQVEVFSKLITSDGRSYYEEAPLGLVPALRLDDGTLLTDLIAVGTYLADQRPERGLAPAEGTRERYQLLSWLGFVATELHKKVLWFLANPGVPAEAKAHAMSAAPRVFDSLEHHLAGREFLVGSRFTVADAYLAWALALCPIFAVEFGERPALRDYAARMRVRPSIRDAMAIERPLAIAAQERQLRRSHA